MEYLLKSSIIIFIFYGCYKLFLKNETYFNTIRGYFITGIMLSFILPLVILPKYVQVEPQVFSTFTTASEPALNLATPLLPESTFNFTQLIFYIYVIGVFILLFQFFIQLSSLFVLLLKHRWRKQSGYYLIETESNISPFSFFKVIVYNANQFEKEELDQVLIHEQIHARQLHSIDTLIVQLLVIFQWFNPFVWLLKKEMQQNLEFITDNMTQQKVSCKKSYQQLLLKTSVPNFELALTNNFYNKLLKNRILMLHKERSTNKSQWKLALIIPFLVVFMLIFNIKTIAQNSNDKGEIIEVKAEILELLISKKATKEDLNKIKKEFAQKGLAVKFSGIKRNDKKEIIAIKVDAKATNGKAAASYAADNGKAITPINISYDNQNNHLSIGSSHGTRHEYRFSSHGDKKMIVKKSHGGETEDVIHIETEGDHDSDASVHVWTSKDGKHRKIKKSKEVIVEVDDDGNETKKEVIKIKRSKPGEKDEFLFIEESDDDANTKTTYIVNGKKMTKQELMKMDKDKIKTIEIKKEVKKKKKN